MVSSQAVEKLDFKRILPIIVIVFVDLLGLSIIIPLLPLFAARFSATPLVIGILQAAYPLMQFIGAPTLGPFWTQACSARQPIRNTGGIHPARFREHTLFAVSLAYHRRFIRREYLHRASGNL
jgi:hypothetical protein